VNALTLAELRKHQADLAWKAEKLRQEWRTLPMGNRSATMGKQVKAMQERADDYAAIIKGLEG
jgi:acyl-CoA reductase-like NAD-dependent aldehyde dehydrogenase